MTLADKKKELKTKRSALLKKAKQATKHLEADFNKEVGRSKRELKDIIISWRGRYYAVVGPILKEANKLEEAIKLLD